MKGIVIRNNGETIEISKHFLLYLILQEYFLNIIL